MTAVAGLVHGARVYMGADSISVDEYRVVHQTGRPKVFRRGSFLFGYTTSFRFGQLLEHALELPEHSPEQSVHAYFVLKLAPTIKALLKENGFEGGGEALIGYKGLLYSLQIDFSMLLVKGYTAIGAGNEPALGSLHTTRRETDPRKRIKKALEAAEAHHASVRRPFVILSS